jgi:hypothetical protein
MMVISHPLKNIPSHAFTIIQASPSEFHAELADIPIRYPKGPITYISNHSVIPLPQLSEEYQNRFVHQRISNLSDILTAIETDESPILFIEYHLSWFQHETPDERDMFNLIGKRRAHSGGPVVLLTTIMDQGLFDLDGKADFFFQSRRKPLKGKRLAFKEQGHIDDFSGVISGEISARKVYGQMKL